MTANMAKKLEEILERLKKLDVIESSVKSIETKLNCLEERTAVLENFRQTTEKDINDLKENGNFTSSHLFEISTEVKIHQVAITDLTQKAEASKELLKELTAKNLYLEAYSRGESIRFMNIEDGSSNEPEDVEETLLSSLSLAGSIRGSEITILFEQESINCNKSGTLRMKRTDTDC